MNIQHGFQDASVYRSGFVSIGNFDGVHLGHQRMISTLVRHAQRDSRPSVVMTFDPHPLELLAPQQVPQRLCTLELRAELLEKCGVDCLVIFPTDQKFLNQSPRAFFDGILVNELQASGLVEGPNFCFGKDRAGNVNSLRDYCTEAGLQLAVVDGVELEGRLVSSSEIRKLIHGGRVSAAAEMLGRPYRISGTVAPGAARGQGLGFPTANLSGCETLLPAEGVYAAVGFARNGDFPAAVHIGPNPTFSDQRPKTEIHLIEFEGGELYGETIAVDFLARLRDTVNFDSVDDLRDQLSRDVKAALRVVRDRSET